MDKYPNYLLDSIMKDPSNKFCFDCGACQPRWASVNNSVLLCLNCAGVHRGLGVNISFVRSLTMDNWDEKHIALLKNGGNRKLKELLDEYNIPINTDIELKYKLKAVDYYRKLLKFEILGDTYIPDKPDILTGLETISEGIKQEKIVDYSSYICSDPPVVEKKKSFFGKVGNFFEKTANQLGSKIKEMKIGEKSKDILDKTAVFIDKKSQAVIKSQFVQKVVDKTKTVFKNKNKPDVVDKQDNNSIEINEINVCEEIKDKQIENFFISDKNINSKEISSDNFDIYPHSNQNKIIEYPSFKELDVNENPKQTNLIDY